MEKKRKNNLSGMIDLNTQKMLWNYDFVPSDNHLLSQDTWQHKSGKVLIAFQAPKYYVVVWGNAENVYNFDNCERKKYIGFKDYFPNILQKLQKILINHTSDTALQKLELQLLDDEDFKVGDIVFIAKGTHFLYKELALIDEINDEYYKLYHILKRNTGGYIYRPLNVDFIPKSKKISLSHVSKKLSDEIKQSLEKELSGLENKVYLHNLFGLGSLISEPTKQTFYENLYNQLESIVKDDSFEKNGIRNFILSHIPEDYKNDDIEGIVEVFYQRLRALKFRGINGLGQFPKLNMGDYIITYPSGYIAKVLFVDESQYKLELDNGQKRYVDFRIIDKESKKITFKDYIVLILLTNGYDNGKDYTIKYFESSPYWENRGVKNVQECWIKVKGLNLKVDEKDFDDIISLTNYICAHVDSQWHNKKVKTNSDTALQQLELQLAISNDKTSTLTDLERWYFTVYPKEQNKYWTPIFNAFKVLEKINTILPSNHQQMIDKLHRILNANINISIESANYPERAGEYVYNLLKDDKNDLANKFLNAIFRYIFDNVPSDQKAEMTKALELIKNSGLNGLFGTRNFIDEYYTAAQELLDSIKDTELKSVIKPYFNSVPKKDRLSEKPKILIFGADAVYVGNACCVYKIKYNVPKELVGKTAHVNYTVKTIEDIFAKAEKNKQGIKCPPYTFDKENTNYILDKYEVLDCNGTCKYFFKIGTEYFDPIYLNRCLKYSGRMFNTKIYDNGNPLLSKSDSVDYILMPIGFDTDGTTLVDFVNDEIIKEYSVKNTILQLFDSPIFETLKIDLLEHLEHQSCRISDLKQLQTQVDEFKRLNSAYQLLTGKECAEIPDVNLNPYVEGQLNLCEFIAEDDDLRPHMWCIGYQSGYALATDPHLLVAVADQYKKSREGRTYNILGYDVTDTYQFPNAIRVLDDTFKPPLTRITIHFDRLETAIKLAKKIPSLIETSKVVMLECGATFRVDMLEKVLYFLDFCIKPEIYLTKNNTLCIKDKDEIHKLILCPIIYDKDTTHYTFVSCADLKYHISDNFYGKENEKLQSVVKGNCVTPEDTLLQTLELSIYNTDKKQ